jgi:hypothetical protein
MLKKSLCIGACLWLAASAVQAQDDHQLRNVARKTLQNYEKAVITLSAVVKLEIKGQDMGGAGDHEIKTQCVAAIIDPSGLAVTSLANLSPQSSMGRIRFGGRSVEIDSQVEEVKYRLSDGTEVPARLVLKDEELDLAFLAPLKPLDEPTRQKISVIPLGDAAAQAELLDPTIFICRATDSLNYVPILEVDKIVAVISTPRTCYLGNMTILGATVFDGQGKFMGIVARCIKAEGNDGMARLSSSMISRLILPAADVARLVPQAKDEVKKSAEAETKDVDKKGPEKKDADKKGSEKKDVEKKGADKPKAEKK